jgi:transposase InsO family protein
MLRRIRPQASCRQVTEAFPWGTAPRFLLRNHGASYGSIFSKRLEAKGITVVVTAPHSPWQNAYVEGVIGSTRRECLGHVVIFNERRLRQVLSSYVDYYHRARTHVSLDKLSALASHPATAQWPCHRRNAGRRVAPSLPAPRGLTIPITVSYCLRGDRLPHRPRILVLMDV